MYSQIIALSKRSRLLYDSRARTYKPPNPTRPQFPLQGFGVVRVGPIPSRDLIKAYQVQFRVSLEQRAAPAPFPFSAVRAPLLLRDARFCHRSC